MVLKRRISYQWQLFIPLVATLWIVIFGLAVWHFNSEREYRRQQLYEQLTIVNSRIISAYEEDIDIIPFLQFITTYYKENPVYDRLRVTLYKDGDMLKCYGEPIARSDSESYREKELQHPTEGIQEVWSDGSGKSFFSLKNTSPDGRLSVYTVLPYDTDILRAMVPSFGFLWIFISVAAIATILAFFSTRYFGQNIRILRSIAERAATDPNFMPTMDFPHDELGDISRQIIHMYNERSLAMQRERREHEVALHAIEEKARSKRELTNNINHELRTPIGVIKGYIDTILENPDIDDAARTHFLMKAQEHVNRLVNLIADVSAITRLEEGSELISTEELNFHDIAYTIANDIRDSGVLGKMEFRFDVPLECKIRGNYNLLAGMLINLAKNAGAYSKGTLCELVMTGEDDEFMYFEFRDNGTGVGEEHLPHLFDRFYRVDAGRTRKAGGTGLGLPIVLNTVKAHGGEIEVFNGELGGLSFKFSLPKYRVRKNSKP